MSKEQVITLIELIVKHSFTLKESPKYLRKK